MFIKKIEMFNTDEGVMLNTIVDAGFDELPFLANMVREANEKPYALTLSPVSKKRSQDLTHFCWAKIQEIANALRVNKMDVYRNMLRDYGQSEFLHIKSREIVPELEKVYLFVDVVNEKSDGTLYVKAYRGLSKMDSRETSILVDGVLEQCKELGIPTEPRYEKQ